MNLLNARTRVRRACRNAANDPSTWKEADIDAAIQTIGNRFVRLTRCLKKVDNVVITSAASAVGALPTNFRPERLLRAWIDGQQRVNVVAFGDLLDKQLDHAQTGVPELLAFDTWASAQVYPTPNANYTLKLQWVEPFTTWTPGVEDAASVTLNLPDDWLAELLPTGPPAILMLTGSEAKFAASLMRQYDAFEGSFLSAGGTGETISERSMVEGLR